jgi:hypothetical protein
MLGQHDHLGVPGDMHGWVEHRDAYRSLDLADRRTISPTYPLNAPEDVDNNGVIGDPHQRDTIRYGRNSDDVVDLLSEGLIMLRGRVSMWCRTSAAAV